MNSFENLATEVAINHTSNSLKNVLNKELYEKNEIKKLSQCFCKTLELTNFIEEGFNYNLLVEKESGTILNFKVIKDV